MSCSVIDQSQLICNVDRLVTDVLSNNINISNVSIQLSALYLPLVDNYDSSLDYFPTITAFINSANRVVASNHSKKMRWGYYNTKNFIDNLYAYKNIILKNNIKVIEQEKVNTKKSDIYMRQMLNHYSRLLIVRVDLGYSKDTSHLVSIETFHKHLKKLRELIGKTESCFEELEGNVIALEQGHDRGYHIHLLLLFDGSRRCKDTHIGKLVGEKWQSVTGGLGSYYNCNNPQYKKEQEALGRLGIGMIHRRNPKEVQNAIRASLYLTQPDKENQHLRVKLRKMKTFTHGIYETAKRRGLHK
ncbi:inovirus-type Gp2 protein [Psychrobacter sp. Ps4]|uniref:YagK/YfjJ domain-containing protein n=1 Tax=Psychrobacter sp. Ps4 TaxID=2790958 RepID=UPI001EDDAA85|nr:inovirus-type Gp2 protein [Psychrobacter sp. Ps4]MCG3808617.1 inovirus-type Gp2 protein [Psychrobacter sp. Ps4]